MKWACTYLDLYITTYLASSTLQLLVYILVISSDIMNIAPGHSLVYLWYYSSFLVADELSKLGELRVFL